MVPVAGWAQMDEIIVSTRRREESLQDVPIAVTAIGAETIERQNLNSLEKIVALAPSVQFDNAFGPADTRITIRGLSNTRGRSNVAFLIDGIDVTTENLVTAGSGLLANRRLLNDVERIELVKGPQSALFGRAAFAGALSYTTKEPGPEPEGKIGVDFAEDGQQQIDFAYETPIMGLEDVLAMRVSGVWWDEDGRYENAISGNDVGGTDGFGGSLTTVFTPTDALKIKARVEYTDEDYEPRPVVRVGGGLPAELVANADGSQDNTWQFQIINPGEPGNENGTAPIRITQDANGDGLADLNPGSTYTCRDPGAKFFVYPKSLLDADLGVGTGFGFTATGLADFGPGICLPTNYGDADNRQVTQSEDPFTGQDYEGTSQQTFRASITASLDADFGTFSYYAGWTDFEGSDQYDQDHQAWGRPDSLFATQQARTETDTDQFSNEIRFTSNFEGPIQTTFGLLYWEETRKLLDQNFIIFCSPVAKVGGKYGTPRAGPTEAAICDGSNGTVTNFQEYARLLPAAGISTATGIPDSYINGTEWEADTESWSAYIQFDWALSDEFRLTFETRYLEETFDLLKPAKSSCTNAFFSAGFNLSQATGEPDQLVSPQQDVVCEAESALNQNILNPQSDW
jgi:outer membrane receptor protein involved in Fe transport